MKYIVFKTGFPPFATDEVNPENLDGTFQVVDPKNDRWADSADGAKINWQKLDYDCL